jgi:D-glycero-D-manno-heptose 1,7-bisphosphate phosphatase
VDGIFYCPHGPNDECECRKPKPGLYKQISKHFNTSLEGVPVIGDSFRDLEAARIVGAKPILVRTGKGLRTINAGLGLEDVPVFENLSKAVDVLLTDPVLNEEN